MTTPAKNLEFRSQGDRKVGIMETVCLKGSYASSEMRSVLDEALKNQREFALARFRKFEAECREFEKRYHMRSDQFAKDFDDGKLGDDAHWFDWYAVNRGRLSWSKKYEILKDIQWTS